MHHAGVKFDFALLVGQPAVADGIIVGIVFDNRDSRDDRVQRVATLLEDVHAAAKRVDSVSAGDDQRALTLGSRRGRALRIARGGGLRGRVVKGSYSCGRPAGQRGKKKSTA